MGHWRRVADFDNSVDQFPLLMKLPLAETNHRSSLEFDHLGAARGHGTHLNSARFRCDLSFGSSMCPAFGDPSRIWKKYDRRVRRLSEVVSCFVQTSRWFSLESLIPISKTRELHSGWSRDIEPWCIFTSIFEKSTEGPSSGHSIPQGRRCLPPFRISGNIIQYPFFNWDSVRAVRGRLSANKPAPYLKRPDCIYQQIPLKLPHHSLERQ